MDNLEIDYKKAAQQLRSGEASRKSSCAMPTSPCWPPV